VIDPTCPYEAQRGHDEAAEHYRETVALGRRASTPTDKLRRIWQERIDAAHAALLAARAHVAATRQARGLPVRALGPEPERHEILVPSYNRAADGGRPKDSA
jgi:hypothetical protein